ncbi:MAG TPA: hypothetical protein VK985_13015 [Rariglobus sp.]|nr:hypothetical protein [Rariglobus sp.]
MRRIPTWLVFATGALLAIGSVVYGFIFAFPHPDFIDENPEQAYRIRNVLLGTAGIGILLLITSFILVIIRGDRMKKSK